MGFGEKRVRLLMNLAMDYDDARCAKLALEHIDKANISTLIGRQVLEDVMLKIAQS